MQDTLPVRRSHNKAPLLSGLALLPLLLVGIWETPRAADPTKGGILVLDDCDPDYKGKAAYADNLTFLDGSGRVVFRVSGLNNCESIGSNHMVAADPARGWVWALENVGHRVRKFDRFGKELLVLRDLKASALAVDPATGNLWVVTSQGTIDGDKTVVVAPDGTRLATLDVSGWDIAYDKKGKAFWIAGPKLAKVRVDNRQVLFQRAIARWCSSCVATCPSTGKVWVTVREHPQVPGSTNALLTFDNDGTLKAQVPLGAKGPFCVSVDPRSGAAWVTIFRRSVQRYSTDGKLEAEHELKALAAQADPAGGDVWVVTPEETLRLSPKGEVLRRANHKGTTSQAWIAAY